MSVLQVKLSFDDGKTAEWYDVESLDYEYKDVTFIDGGGESVEIDYWNQPLRIKSQLNENQQIVLDWLKERYQQPIIINPVGAIFALHDELVKDSEIDAVEAYEGLTSKEESQVLQAFSAWVEEQEEIDEI